MNPTDTPSEVLEGHEVHDSTALATLVSRAEIDQQIATAHKYPRSISGFRKEALAMVTLTEVIAQECIYALPRDGKTIEGPSARFAEIVLHAWGNSRAGARVVHEDAEFITSQGVCHDLQRNVAITFEVRRRITDKRGNRYGADMVGVTANAACSIALRNSILKVVPKAFWSELYTAARKTAIGDVKTLANKRVDAIAAFQHYGVNEAQVLGRLGRGGVQDITLDDLAVLFGILTAIKEGEITPEAAFAPEAAAKAPVKMPESTDDPAPEKAREGELMPKAEAPKAAPANDKPASAGDLKAIRKKAADATVTDEEICKRFHLEKLEDATSSQVKPIIDWLKNPAS